MIAYELDIANTTGKKTKGLLGRKSFPPGEGLLLERCNSIHMFFMKFPIDVLFVDENYKVVKIVKDLKIWMMSMSGQAAHTIELPVGTLALHRIRVGDELVIEA
ncbi:MAG: DUF192 domain-containing protein [Planctomycetota bacterium]